MAVIKTRGGQLSCPPLSVFPKKYYILMPSAESEQRVAEDLGFWRSAYMSLMVDGFLLAANVTVALVTCSSPFVCGCETIVTELQAGRPQSAQVLVHSQQHRVQLWCYSTRITIALSFWYYC